MEDNNNSLGESVSTRLVFRGFEVKTIKFVPAPVAIVAQCARKEGRLSFFFFHT
jgi:hypothetical protein